MHPTDYSHFFKFIDKYLPAGFVGIRRDDLFITDLETELCRRNQFFLLADILKLNILFTSSGTENLLGFPSEELDATSLYKRVLPDDLKRINLFRHQIFGMGMALLDEKAEKTLLSSNFRFTHSNGKVVNLLIQCLFFHTEIPDTTIYMLEVFTDISKQRHTRNGYHYYFGNNITYFRYPDKQLLKTGYIFSDRELEILRCIAEEMGSEQIAEELSLSRHTVNTHRRNILKKTGKSSTHELVDLLREKGIL